MTDFPTATIVNYHDGLKQYGIHIHEESEETIPMKKLDWPRKRGHRQPIGGSDDSIIHETTSINWKNDELWVYSSNEPSFEARRISEKEICFFGCFHAQLDGDVAYVPKDDQIDFLIIVCEKEKHQNHRIFHAIKFTRGSTVHINTFVIHSMPIPIFDNCDNGEFEVDVYHRPINAKSHFMSSANIQINLSTSENKHFIPLKDEPPSNDSKEPNLLWHFTSKTLFVEHVSPVEFDVYGKLVQNSIDYEEQIRPAHWPYLKKSSHNEKHSKVGSQRQEFRMICENNDGSQKHAHIKFEGLTGNYLGKEGNPGISYNFETKEYTINTLTTRPDGSCYIQAKNSESKFAMIFALPDANNGDPIEDTLRVFLFEKGQALSLYAGVWHSLPISIVPEKEAEFLEIICETNASIDINLPYECGSGLKFVNNV